MEENIQENNEPKSNNSEQNRYKKKRPIDETTVVDGARLPEGTRLKRTGDAPRSRSSEDGAGKRPRKRPPVDGERPRKRPPVDGERPRKRPPVDGERPKKRPPVDGERPKKRPPVDGERPKKRPPVDDEAPKKSRNEMKKRSVRNRRKKRALIYGALLLLIALVVGAAMALLYQNKYGLSDEEMSSSKYYDISRTADLVVIMDNEISGVQGMWSSETAYFSYEFVINNINSRFYWDENNNDLLYTLEDGTVSASLGDDFYTQSKADISTGYQIVKTEGENVYIASEYVQLFTNIDLQTYEEPYRIVVTTEFGDVETYTAKKDTEVRYQAGVKSPIISYVTEGDTLILMEEEEEIEDWTKVCTMDGYIGYVQTKNLKDFTTVTMSREYEEQVYTSISLDYTINMVWHQVTSSSGNDTVYSLVAETTGLTTIAPTWFFIDSVEGDVTSLASQTYVNYAHQLGIEVWAVLNDFDGGISSQDETYQTLSSTEARANIINTVIAECIRTGVDGINVDIELVSTEAGVHYIQFIRELSVECRKNSIILSIANYPPKAYNMHYAYEEQGIVADYVIIMGYDEHYSGSLEVGSVSSITYIEEAVTEMLTMVDADKIISAIPFYTRLWSETDKTEEELAEQEGTQEADYLTNVGSQTFGMEAAQSKVSDAGVTPVWDELTMQYYATWTVDEVTYSIWLEDEESIAAKLQVMQEYELAGTAAWKLGLEDTDIWTVIQKYVN